MLMAQPAAILDAIATPAFAIEARGLEPVFSAVNAAFTSISGITSSEARGRTALDLLGTRHGEVVMRHQIRVATTGQPESYKSVQPCIDGNKSFLTSLHPMAPGGHQLEPPMVIGTMIELEDAADTHERESGDALANAEEVRQFITMAAHDLRTPMRQVASIAHLLSESEIGIDQEGRELIAMLGELGEKAQSMIGEVLDYARIVDLPQTESQFEFGVLCRDIFAVLDPGRRHDLSCSDVEIVCDRVALQIVTRNLVDNAIKHSGAERVVLDIELRAAPAGMVEMTIRDNGNGFPDPALAFLAGDGFRYGTGFGLLGLKRLVSARAGLIWAVPPGTGIGAEIRCLLPGRIVSDAGGLS